jgi:hypothetical protein
MTMERAVNGSTIRTGWRKPTTPAGHFLRIMVWLFLLACLYTLVLSGYIALFGEKLHS